MKYSKDIKVNPILWQFFGEFLNTIPDEYNEEDESKVLDLISDYGIDATHFSDLLYLFLNFKYGMMITGIMHHRNLRIREYKNARDKLTEVIDNTSNPDLLIILHSALREIAEFIESLEHEDYPSIGRPKKLDGEMVRACSPVGQFLYLYNIIPSKNGKPITSKNQVYRFIYDFILAAGYKLSPPASNNNYKGKKTLTDPVPEYLKEFLENDLKEMDPLKDL